MATEKFMRDFHEYNQLMRRIGSKEKTLDEYAIYRRGRQVKTSKTARTPMQATTYRRPSPTVPSGDTYDTFTASKKEMHYTGDKLMGIATMHKSNSIPIFNHDDAKDVARMRR